MCFCSIRYCIPSCDVQQSCSKRQKACHEKPFQKNSEYWSICAREDTERTRGTSVLTASKAVLRTPRMLLRPWTGAMRRSRPEPGPWWRLQEDTVRILNKEKKQHVIVVDLKREERRIHGDAILVFRLKWRSLLLKRALLQKRYRSKPDSRMSKMMTEINFFTVIAWQYARIAYPIIQTSNQIYGYVYQFPRPFFVLSRVPS